MLFRRSHLVVSTDSYVGLNIGRKMQVQIKYEVVDCRSGWCACDVFVGVVWLKSCKFEQRITRNVIAKFGDRIRDMLELVERETLLETDGRS